MPWVVQEGCKAIELNPYDLETIISTCKRKCTAVEMEITRAAMPALADIFKQNGEVTEEEYTRLHLLVDIEVRRHCLEKNEKVLCHQRGVNLTLNHTVLRFEVELPRRRLVR